MEKLFSTGVIFGLFVLRCLVPLAITVGAGYLLVRLDERWRAAAAAERQAWRETEEAEQPARPTIPGTFPVATAPCWVLKGCDPAKRTKCPAYLQPNGACWLARLKAEGELPSSCLTCTLFAQDAGWNSVFTQEAGRDTVFTQQAGRD